MEDVGPQLRKTRVTRGMSLTKVAEMAGITKGFLSLAERGKTRVSVPVLLKICEVLDVTIGSLFTYPSEPLVQGGVPIYMGGVDLQEFLLTPVSEKHIQVMRTTMQPQGGSDGVYTLDAESIFVVVTQGQLSLELDGQVQVLEAGHSMTFSARKPHSWHNPLSTESQVLWVISPPLSMKKQDALARQMGDAGIH
ncbi:helix-turn-helix domain-containing protein [Cryobacterium sp. MP_M3]|nr:XRE family transcriptional regulator [Cryobacterium sp. MP_M3]